VREARSLKAFVDAATAQFGAVDVAVRTSASIDEHVCSPGRLLGRGAGRPPEFSGRGGITQPARHGRGRGRHHRSRPVFVRYFELATDDTGLPDDSAFRGAISDYMR
jgi:hypothetical protein